MGQTLSEPITTKESTALENGKYKVGSSCMQGWRVSMEDAHVHILSLGPEDPSAAYFGVFDGHGGAKVAAYCANNLHRHILRRQEYEQGKVEEALVEGFLECDRVMKTEESLKDEMAGATAVVVMVKGDSLYCANAGDSRCVTGIGGAARPLSFDHKPMDTKERARIEAAGGFVEFNRVNGNLALSRAMGDFVFKMNDKLSQADQIVTCQPDVEAATIGEDWDFLLLACDGIWDVLSNQEVVDFVTQRIGQAMEPEDICEELMTRCLSPDCQMGGLGCDNMTCVLVCLLHDQPYQVLVERCARQAAAREEERRARVELELGLVGEEGEPGNRNETEETDEEETEEETEEKEEKEEGGTNEVALAGT